MRHVTLVLLAALSLVTVFAAPAVTAGSSTLVVDDDNAECPNAGYSSISGAIQDATSGDTIEVCAGTYVETLYVNTPDITIAGAGPGEVTIDASQDNTRGVTAEADGFTLSGVTVSDANDYGVKVEIGDETAIQNIELHDLVVEGSDRSEVDLHGVEGGQLSDLVLEGQGTSGNGLAFTDSHDITVDGLTTSGNDWGGVAFYTSGEYTGDASTTNIALSGYDDYTEENPVYLQGEDATFQDIDTPAFPVHVEYHDAGAFASSFVFRQPNLTEGLEAAGDFFPSEKDKATVLDSRDGSLHTQDGMSLDLAADVAGTGADVVAHGGTYAEDVTVGTADLTLVGSNAGVAGATDRGPESTIAGQVVLSADGVALDGFEVSPPDPTTNPEGEALRVSNSPDDVVVRNNVVRDFDGSGLPNWEGADAIVAFGGDDADPIEDVTITRNLVQDVQGNDVQGGATGVSIQGNVQGATVTDNVIDNVGMEATGWAFGLVARGTSGHDEVPADVEFADNTVTGLASNPNTQWAGVGIGSEADATEMTVRGNAVTDVELAVENKDDAVLDASHNWWGTPFGPTANDNTAPVTGAPVEGPVDFAPWCLQPSCSVNDAVHDSPAPHVSAGSTLT